MRLVLLLLVSFALWSCQNEGTTPKDTEATTETNTKPKTNTGITPEDPFKEQEPKNIPDSVAVPAFTIDISLSPAARKKLNEAQETIIVDVAFVGRPKNPNDPNMTEDGQYIVGTYVKELPVGKTRYKIRDAKLSGPLFAGLRDPNYFISMNVYSGRKSSPNNLLSVDYLYKDIEFMAGKISAVSAKLISEN